MIPTLQLLAAVLAIVLTLTALAAVSDAIERRIP